MSKTGWFTFFGESQKEFLREKTLELLEVHGVKMDHSGVIKALEKAGAKVDFDTQVVRFPREFIQEQIDKAPKQVMLGSRNDAFKVALPRPDGTFHTRTNTGGQVWIEPETGVYRRVRPTHEPSGF